MGIEFPPGVPEEMRQYIETQVERHEMSMFVNRHELIRFFDELSLDQANQLNKIFGLLDDDPRSSYFQGFLQASMKSQFGICPACGKDHAVEASKIADGELVEEKSPVIGIEIIHDDDHD